MTLPEIAGFVGRNDVEFLGFVVDDRVMQAFQTRFRQDNAAADLTLWHAFEADNHDAFVGMYQFWIRRKG